MALQPNVVDVVFSTPDKTPPDHAGPTGRITSLVNGVVENYVPGAPGVQPKNQIAQRTGFRSYPTGAANVADGAPLTPTWLSPELLAAQGEKLLSVASHIPRVFNGTQWSYYKDARVVTRQLHEDIAHTTNHTLQAPDSAWLNGVTCMVWEEFNPATNAFDSSVGFRSDNGAWIVAPRRIYVATTAHPGMTRVVTDGNVFWVVSQNVAGDNLLKVAAYDGLGHLNGSTTVARKWTTSPGYFDIAAPVTVTQSSVTYSMVLVQPNGFTNTNTDVGIRYDLYSWTGSLNHNGTALTGAHSVGPVAFMRNTRTNAGGGVGLTYVAALLASTAVHVYELNDTALNHDYLIATPPVRPPDSMTGYCGDDGTVHIAISTLAPNNPAPANGPAYDPALRQIRIYTANRAGDPAFLLKIENSLIAQSREFRLGDSHALVGYYQSGSGSVPTTTVETISHHAGDYFTGPASQDIPVSAGDTETGGPITYVTTGGSMGPTAAHAAIAHNAGDSLTASTQRWVLLNATFSILHEMSYLHIAGSAHAGNNGDWVITEWISATTVVTDAVSVQGNRMVDDTLAGVTATAIASLIIAQPDPTPPGGTIPPYTFSPGFVFQQPIPDNITAFYPGGTVAVTGSVIAANNATFPIVQVRQHQLTTDTNLNRLVKTIFLCGAPPAGTAGDGYPPNTLTLVLTPLAPNLATFVRGAIANISAEARQLVMSGTASNNGTFPVTLAAGPVVTTAAGPRPEVFTGTEGAKIELVNVSHAYLWYLQNFTFTPDYAGAVLTLSGGTAGNNGAYIIGSIIDTHTIIAKPGAGALGQVAELFSGAETIKVQKQTTAQLPLQPTWFLIDMESPQPIIGEFERGVAYADWRFDGAAAPGQNPFYLGLSSVTTKADGTLAVTLPYRAQSFTAGQTFPAGETRLQENTVGLKEFSWRPTLAEAVVNAGEMLIGGPLATRFTDSGFAEDNLSLGQEAPWLIQKTSSAFPVALTTGSAYQYVVVLELTDENGDRTFSLPSPPLDVVLSGSENAVILAGRLMRPTNHVNIALSIYRTAIIGGIPTTEHYKITSDLDVNGVTSGFAFYTVGNGPDADTWSFTDQVPDAGITSSEILYTDKALLPRFPAPAFSRGVGSFRDRTWLIGYDGAIWPSGEKTEGDAVWFFPGFRIVLPTDDKPVAVASMDDYLIVGCERTMWYLAPAQMPDATGRNGALPTPVQLPFPNGCVGPMHTVREGVVYESTAGGVWLITRQLTNHWLSQPLQGDLAGVTALAVDAKQRLFCATNTASLFVFDMISQVWARYDVGGATGLLAAYRGAATFQDPAYVLSQEAGLYADVRNDVPAAIPMSADLAKISFGTVRNWKRLWAMQLVGQYKAPHTLNVSISSPDDGGAPANFSFEPASNVPYIYEFNPLDEEAGSWNVSLSTSFKNANESSNAAVWELITAEIGVEQGIARAPAATQRIPSK